MRSDAWRPLLEGDARRRAKAAVRDIAAAVSALPVHEPWLGAGAAGRALLFGYLAEAWPGRGYETDANRFVDEALALIAGAPARAKLLGGYVGVAWVLEHLRRFSWWDDGGDPNAEVDEALLADLAAAAAESAPYDLVAGLVGIGVYALERLPSATARECLARVVRRLGASAVEQPSGLAWRTPPERLAPAQRDAWPRGVLDLGVAHGAPGVVALLAGAIAADVAAAEARRLYERSTAWIAAEGGDARPTWVEAVGARRGPPARCAWCYGDPGVAAALHAAARSIGDARTSALALEAARTATLRREETTGVVDAGLCHGAAGVAHLFNRIGQASGDGRIIAAAERWFERTLEMRNAERGVAGFAAWASDGGDAVAALRNAGFLTGAVGIGLALLGAVSDVAPAWDRLLVASKLA